MNKYLIVAAALAVSACDSSPISGPIFPTQPPVPNESPTGLWVGTDSNGMEWALLVAETHEFRLVDEFLNQGSDVLVVAFGDEVFNGNDFQLVTPFGSTFSDGTTSADCALSGTVAEGQSMSLNVDCTTTAELQISSKVALVYDVLYERNSLLNTIAGSFDDGSGSVLDIAADGTIFKQDAVTLCTTNGQVTIIDSAFNVYNVQYDISGCVGDDSIFNGSTFAGLGTLDDTSVPEQLIIATTGDVAGRMVSVVDIADRL